MRKFNKNTMYGKLVKQFVLFIVLPIFLINTLLNNFYTHVIIKKNSEQVEQNLQQLASSIKEEISNISLSAATLAQDKGLQNLITSWKYEKSDLIKLQMSKQIVEILNYLFNYNKDVESIVFFFKDEGVYTFRKDLKVEESKIRQKEWYKKAIQNKEKVINIKPTEKILIGIPDKPRGLSAAIAPSLNTNSNYNNKIEVIYVMFKTSIFDSIYEKSSDKEINEVVISDEKGEIIISSEEKLLGKSTKEIAYIDENLKKDNYVIKISDKKAYVTTYDLTKYGWKMFYIKDYNLLMKEMKNAWILFISFFIVLVGLFIIFIAITVKSIIDPLQELIKKMRSAEKGDFDDEIHVEGTEEIINLGQSYNNMIREIKELMYERDLKEKQRSKEEIKALQAQINPHFIYNTLNCIRLMAMMAKATGIKNITDAFMKLLSLTFKSQENMITVKEEIECLQQYVYIMKIRYGDNFNIKYNIDSNIREFLIIKLILQPLVENAITHGIVHRGIKGKIIVNGYIKCDNIIIEVIDNGLGMSEQKINEVLINKSEHNKSFNKIGVINVDKRLKLNFGKEYGITIKSRVNCYTKIIVKIPKLIVNVTGRDYCE